MFLSQREWAAEQKLIGSRVLWKSEGDQRVEPRSWVKPGLALLVPTVLTGHCQDLSRGLFREGLQSLLTYREAAGAPEAIPLGVRAWQEPRGRSGETLGGGDECSFQYPGRHIRS